MTNEQKLKFEVDRVRQMMTEAIANVEIDGGNIRFFSYSILCAAIELHCEIEGVEGVEQRLVSLIHRKDSASPKRGAIHG